MATTTIPWGDGSGDNIYLTYPSASGNQTVVVTSDANTRAARSKIVTFSTGSIAQPLTVNQASGLPYDAEIEFIQSSGTQFINLPLTVPSSSYFEVSGHIIPVYKNNNRNEVFGGYPYLQFTADFYSRTTNNNTITYTSRVGTVSTSGGWVGIIGEKTYFLLSTTKKISQGVETAISRPLTQNITAFRLFGGYRDDARYPIKICDMAIKVGDNLAYDLIAVRLGQVGYMYDKLSGTLYGNNGTGNFTLGPDK